MIGVSFDVMTIIAVEVKESRGSQPRMSDGVKSNPKTITASVRLNRHG